VNTLLGGAVVSDRSVVMLADGDRCHLAADHHTNRVRVLQWLWWRAFHVRLRALSLSFEIAVQSMLLVERLLDRVENLFAGRGGRRTSRRYVELDELSVRWGRAHR
jgi:hypothetical protein